MDLTSILKRFIPSITALVLGFPTLWLIDAYFTLDSLPEWAASSVGLFVGAFYIVMGFVIELKVS